jgi:hypothetical protein
MQRITCLLTISLAALAVGCSRNPQGPEATATPAKVVTCADAEKPTEVPPIPNKIDSTCATIPTDMNGSGDNQAGPDLYSWLTFVAVNWPVDASTCTANAGVSILTSAPDPVWMSYLADEDIFVASGPPATWCHLPGGSARFGSAEEAKTARRAVKLAKLPPKVRALAEQHPEVGLFLHYNAKGHGLISTIKLTTAPAGLKEILDATGQVVTDQNGRFVRFTVNIGPTEYKDIMEKTLWKKEGQQSAGDLKFTNGAMEFKAAWKVLGAGDEESHFFTQMAIVYNDEDGSPSPGQNPVKVGLVGLHITHKTPRQQDWLWSTFVQKEITKSFNNSGCLPKDCPPNVQTAPTPFVELNPSGTPLNKPVQVVGVSPTTAASLNTTFQGLLQGTPWAYYSLVSTQWKGGSGPPVKPPQLGNPVLETFVSITTPYSCLDCHNTAKDYPGGSKSDFSFAINAKQ